MHLVDMSSLSILFQAKSGVLRLLVLMVAAGMFLLVLVVLGLVVVVF